MVLILDASTLTYQSFRAQCLVPNRPALIRNALSKFHSPPFPRDAVEAPECTLPLSSSSSSPAVSAVLTPEGLLKYFGSDHAVPVYYHPTASAAVAGRGEEAACKEDAEKGEDHVECSDVTVSSTMSLHEVLTRWALCHERNTSLSSTDPDVQPQQGAIAHNLNWLYLMNWHFQQEWESHFLHNNTTTTSSSSRISSNNDDVGSNPKAPSKPSSTNRAIGSVAGLYEVPSFLGPDLMHPYFCRVQKAAVGGTPETTTWPQEQQTGEASTSPTTVEQSPSSTLRGFGNGQEDYRFAYLGLPGSWTPCHYDVFGTYSWSLNLSGTKLWYFLTESSQAQVIPFSVGSPADSRSSDEHDDALKNEAAWRFRVGTPLAADLRVMSDVELDAFEQQAGDLVFVPSCYIHQVHNLDGPLVAIASPASTTSSSVPWVASINHNWIAPEGLPILVRMLTEELRYLLSQTDAETKALFGDDWYAMVQRMLRGGANWDVDMLRGFLSFAQQSLIQGWEHPKLEEETPAGDAEKNDDWVRWLHDFWIVEKRRRGTSRDDEEEAAVVLEWKCALGRCVLMLRQAVALI